MSEARYAVVRIPSHGCSGTVIETGPGRTLILSCAHAFEDPRDRARPIRLDVPHTDPGPPRHARIRLLKLGVADRDDLSLLELADGPLPFVCPIAPAGFRPAGRDCLSCGYDEMRSLQALPAHITGRCAYWTREAPWHGRSGGALIDQATGQLVGVVSGYESSGLGGFWSEQERKRYVLARKPGIYVDLETIRSFVALRGADGQPGNDPRLAPPPRPAPFNPGFNFAPPDRPACPT